MLSPRALYQDVAERLRQQIFARQLEPGSWIDELKLCAEYGISRTPLREALKVLAVEGLVTMKVRRGAYVTEMSRDDVAQVYHLLALLESDAVGEVAAMPATHSAPNCARCTTGWRSRCASATPSSPPTNSSTTSCWTWPATAGAADRDRPAQGDEAQPPPFAVQAGRLADSLAEHRAIMQAIESAMPPRATQLMKAHFDSGLEAAA
jgi:DNA-binding GntR family transcriptional regulator